jgi:hypothetical protein
MAERDDDPKPTIDPDRAAILERRKRFIALALSGLSTTACTAGDSKSTAPKSDTRGEVAPPNACLKVAPREDEGDDAAAPHPCLSVPIQRDPPPDPPPQVCLKIAQPPADTEAESGETGGSPEPAPRPCLKKSAPKPCLKMASPE